MQMNARIDNTNYRESKIYGLETLCKDTYILVQYMNILPKYDMFFKYIGMKSSKKLWIKNYWSQTLVHQEGTN